MKLVTGNDLGTGDVTWWTGSGWSRHIGDAANAGDNAETVALSEEAARRVNAPYVIDADDQGLPLHIKDRVRAAGPSVRKDLSIHPEITLEKA